MKSLISVQDLTHEYVTYQKAPGLIGSIKDFVSRKATQHVALSDIQLSIAPGEMVGLLGPNGAGKTTLMKILSGLVHPTHGVVQVMGHRPHQKSKHYLRHLGLVLGQRSQLMWDLPPSDTLALLKEIYGVADKDYHDRLTFLLDSLGAAHRLDTPVRKLSLGERMKFELVAALLHHPSLLLLDEPTIGLDIASQRAIHRFLRDVNKRLGTTIILTSHNARDVEALSDRLIILRRGRIHYVGTLVTLLNGRQGSKIVRVETNADLHEYPIGFQPIGDNRWECEIPSTDVNKVLLGLASTVPIENVTTQDKPLEDILYAMFSGGTEEDRGRTSEEDDD